MSHNMRLNAGPPTASWDPQINLILPGRHWGQWLTYHYLGFWQQLQWTNTTVSLYVSFNLSYSHIENYMPYYYRVWECGCLSVVLHEKWVVWNSWCAHSPHCLLSIACRKQKIPSHSVHCFLIPRITLRNKYLHIYMRLTWLCAYRMSTLVRSAQKFLVLHSISTTPIVCKSQTISLHMVHSWGKLE